MRVCFVSVCLIGAISSLLLCKEQDDHLVFICNSGRLDYMGAAAASSLSKLRFHYSLSSLLSAPLSSSCHYARIT